MPLPTDRQFAAVWRAWDQHPGRESETDAMVNACNIAADLLGMDRTHYRDLLQSWHRAGLDYLACIRAVRDAWLRYSR